MWDVVCWRGLIQQGPLMLFTKLLMLTCCQSVLIFVILTPIILSFSSKTQMATNSICSTLFFSNPQHRLKTLEFQISNRGVYFYSVLIPNFTSNKGFSSLNPHIRHNPFGASKRLSSISSKSLATVTPDIRNYEFSDGGMEVELRLPLGGREIHDSRDILVDTDESSLTVKMRLFGSFTTLIETSLYDKIKPGETIWYIDEDQLVVSLKKHDPDLKWLDAMESWESLKSGVIQLLKGTSIFIVGDSTEINQKVAQELAVGIGYTPLNTSELLQAYGKQSIASWVTAEGAHSVAEAEGVVLESLSSFVRTVVATEGGEHGAASRDDKWRHLYAGFTIWLSQSEASDENSAEQEARRQIQEASQAYSNAEVVVKLGGWDPNLAQSAAQACLSALKRLILSDKKLPGKKSLYIRLGCRGDWPNIQEPGWNPASGNTSSA